MAKKYDIVIHDMDPHVKPENQNGIIAESPEALEKIFGQCGQRVEILREYEDEESRNYGHRKPLETPKDFQFANGGGMNRSTGFMKVDPNLPQYNPSDKPQSSPNPAAQPQYIKATEPPRYFEIGGIKCKMENGKMYQKQWMRLSETESQEFRIVSDANNKICPIKGKHIEVMKWVMVEDDNSGDTTSSEKKLELING